MAFTESEFGDQDTISHPPTAASPSGATHLEDSTGRRGSTDSNDSVQVEAIGGQSAADLPTNYYKSASFVATFLSFGLSYQASYLGYVLPANALTIINMELGPSEDIIWVLLVFVLLQGITFALVGRLSDLFGRRWFYIGGNLLAVIGFVVSGSAKNIDTIIGGSTLSGIGSAIQLASVIVGGELVERRYRFIMLGCTEFMFGPIAMLAPKLTRVFYTQSTWRWVYYLPCLFSGLSLILQIMFYHPPKFHQLHERQSKVDILKGLDYLGVIIFVGSFTSLLFGISWGGQKYPWHNYRVITTIVVGGVGLICFGLYERFGGVRHPLMPVRLFRNRNYIAVIVVVCVGSMTFYGLSIVWPQQVASLFTTSQDRIGWMSCSLTGGAIFGQFVGGFAGFVPKVKWQLIICCITFTSFIGGMAAVTPSRETMAVTFCVLGAFSIGIMETITPAAGPLVVSGHDTGLANGVQYAIRSIASNLAASIFVTILNNKLSKNLPKYIAPSVVEAGLPADSVAALLQAITSGNAAAVEAVPGITPKIIAVAMAAAKQAFSKSFQVIYLVTIAFGACSILAAFSISSEKLEQCMTSEVTRKLQGVDHEHGIISAKSPIPKAEQ